MVTKVELLRTVNVANVLGEGVLWNQRRQTAWWTDIEGSRLFEYDPALDSLVARDTPRRVACFGFVEGSDDLIVAFDDGIGFYDCRSGSVDWLVEPGLLPEGVRFNDGKIDPSGRFWVGTMIEDRAATVQAGALYCFDRNAALVERISNVTISNGLCWSPDASAMYHADSPRKRISVYRFDLATGTLSGRETFARTPRGVYPDGSTVDENGGVWNAQWDGSQVVRYTDTGQIDLVVPLPVSRPTCVAFGGADLHLLFVTSARMGLQPQELARQPNAGDLFVYRTNLKGLPACLFRQRHGRRAGTISVTT